MPLILNIDTSTEHASICVAEDQRCLSMLSNDQQKEHGSWLHPAILEALAISGKCLNDLQAIGITTGPGSYTGLRVGMSAAKGLCFALNIPLIGLNTLEAMAAMASKEEVDYVCPMIDARRMEVFTALYTKALEPVLPPCAIILDQHSFADYLTGSKVLFFGNGKKKFEEVINNAHAIFKNLQFNASQLSIYTYEKYNKYEFLDIVYAEPFYIKDL